MHSRITRNIHLICILALVVAGLAIAGSSTVTLVVGDKAVFLHTSPIYRDDKVYVPIAALSAVGANAQPTGKRHRDDQKVQVTAYRGASFTADAEYIDDQLMLPICDIAQNLGVIADWEESSKTLTLRAQVTSIDYDGSELRVNTSFPVSYDVRAWKSKNRLIVHLNGTDVSEKVSSVVRNTTSTPVRIGSDIVLDMPGDFKHKLFSPDKTASLVVQTTLTGYRTVYDRPSANTTIGPPPPSGTSISAPTPDASGVLPEVSPPVSVSSVSMDRQDDNRAELTVSLTNHVKYVTSMTRNPAQFVIELPNATIGENVGNFAPTEGIVRAISVQQGDGSTVRIVIDLSRVVIPNVDYASASQLKVTLSLPRRAGGSLASKIIVIDPGHGGRDQGATACGGASCEKVTNLEIAKRVQAILADAGVCAMLTRSSDVFIPLGERVDYARRQSADLFVSIHGNSTQIPAARSGIETYFHRGDSSGRELAACVHGEVMKVAELPDCKVRQDPGRIGFQVLRNSAAIGLPAILIEVGFVNHPNDWSRIKDGDWQQRFAEAVVRGIQAYVEGTPGGIPPVRKVEKPSPSPSEAPIVAVSNSNPLLKAAQEKTGASVVAEPSASGPHRPGEIRQ